MLRIAIVCIVVEAMILGFLVGCYYGYRQAMQPVLKPQPATIRSMHV